MTILHLVDRSDVTDGCARHVFLLAREQHRRGHRVQIVTSGGDAMEQARAEGLDVHVLPAIGHETRSIRGFQRARAAVRAFRPDIVHAHHFYAANIAWFASRDFRPRLVQTVHAVIPPIGLLPHCVGLRLIAVSDAVRAGLIARDPELDPRITVIRNGSDFVGDEETLRGLPAFSELLAAKRDAMVIAFIGRIVEVKGWRVLIDAIGQSIEHGDAAEGDRGQGTGEDRARKRILLAVAGSGPDEPAMREALRDLGIAHVFFGSVPNVRPLLEEADVLVVPSLRMEGLPMLLVEAGLAGAAVVASRTDGIPEIIDDGVHGLLVPPGDVEALASALVRMLQDAGLRARLASKLRERVLAEFTVEEMTERTLQVYGARRGGIASSLQ